VPPDQAAAVIFGYACALDVTAADLQASDDLRVAATAVNAHVDLSGATMDLTKLSGEVNGGALRRGGFEDHRKGQRSATLIRCRRKTSPTMPRSTCGACRRQPSGSIVGKSFVSGQVTVNELASLDIN
jgi:hypothetical protein